MTAWESFIKADHSAYAAGCPHPDSADTEQYHHGISRYYDVGSATFKDAPAEVENARRWFLNATSDDVLGSFFDQSVENGFITCRDIFSEGSSTCRHSFYFNRSNVLLFRSRFGVFFVLQMRRCVDALIIPHVNAAVGRGAGSVKNECSLFMGQFVSQFQELARYIEERSSFGGLIVANHLPYHYYYDDLPGYMWLRSTRPRALERVDVFSREGECFFPAHKLPGASGRMHVLPLGKNREIHTLPGSFLLSTARNDRYPSGDILALCDKAVVDYCRDHPAEVVSRDLVEVDWRWPTLWIGILAGKRLWVDQEEAIRLIIDKDTHRIPINVVFDGTTSDWLASPQASSAHEDIINRILDNSRVGSNRIINLNGRRSCDKIYVASKTKFFIADAATSSMYVSRMFRHPGILHSLGRAAVKGHKHGPAFKLNDERVIDLEPEQNWATSNYSINAFEFRSVYLREAKGYLPLNEGQGS